MKEPIIFSMFILLTWAGFAQDTPPPPPFDAEIVVEQAGEQMSITGMFHNNTGEDMSELEYKLSAVRKSRGGKSSSNQGGHFDAPSGESVQLSRVSINVGEEDDYSISLKILDQNGRLLVEKELERD